ncbi:rhamnan synthesis F family protein [Marinomonas sp. GJ51-6]|uniref:rhamnan synthesis F family protein n=1 Tax=Marinomonas sp. GJ51-6 TaxID=2992802 RepID=UPI002934859B|nr:rhamnan synthesis F family protein [Marinomonas sp. GJ51-6]WOD06158.1 rhamnan synthesis F family protein [Marinomonas sp. GJ51-6]
MPTQSVGCFGTRPEALKQLLEKTYQYDDFPAEPLPNDGTELHALERMIGLLAEKNGFKQLFYYPKNGCFTHDQTYVLSEYVNSVEGLQYQLDGFEHVSFDVFDTLVRRRYFVPDYAKLLLAKDLEKKKVVKDAQQFVVQRNHAEFEVRQAKKFIGDVTIFETYLHLASLLNWTEEQAVQYAEQEFAHDLAMIEPKDEMVDLFNSLISAGKRITVMSDTYYTLEQVEAMLSKVGVSIGYELLVSSELGKRKDNGTMWQYLKDSLPHGQSFIHVGDNAVADAQIPGDFGFRNLHILNPIDKWQAAGWKNPFTGDLALDEAQILKWGRLVSDFGRFPFLGE